MRVADDGADPKRGIDVAKAFVADKVPVIVGPFSSAVAAPASALYAEAGLPRPAAGCDRPGGH